MRKIEALLMTPFFEEMTEDDLIRDDYEGFLRKFLAGKGIKAKRPLFFLPDDPLFPSRSNPNRKFHIELQTNLNTASVELPPSLNSLYKSIVGEESNIQKITLLSDQVKIEYERGEISLATYGKTFYYREPRTRGFGSIPDAAFREIPQLAKMVMERKDVVFEANGYPGFPDYPEEFFQPAFNTDLPSLAKKKVLVKTA